MTDARIHDLLARAEAALAGASPLLSVQHPAQGDRAQAEEIAARAPATWGYKPEPEELLRTLDVACMAITADPTSGVGYALAAQCVYRLGYEDRDCFNEEALDAARPWAARAAELQPEIEAGWEAWAQIESYRYEFREAERVLGEIFRRFGDAGLYARSAFLFFRLQADVDQAINWGALAWQQEEDAARLVETLFGMGTVYEDSGRQKHAFDTYRVICEKDPDNAWGKFLLARVTLALGGIEEARQAIDEAIKLSDQPQFRELRAEIARASGVRMPGDSARSMSSRLRAAPSSSASGERSAIRMPASSGKHQTTRPNIQRPAKHQTTRPNIHAPRPQPPSTRLPPAPLPRPEEPPPAEGQPRMPRKRKKYYG
ncbi:MAG: tetratricopeptide repeat protein [Planctomycetes bacterium]|nr:tetratricopeptide repeat protein [Planctomycetota bacterium]